MSEFVPPYPPRPNKPLGVLAMMRAARKNFLSIFDQSAFEYAFFSIRALNRPIFVCNSPDTVAYALVNHHDNFERKTAEMRNAFAPLIGDGLLISDGETWRRRRPIIAPIVHQTQLPMLAPRMVEAATEIADGWVLRGSREPIDVMHEMETLTAEIVCRTVFGRTLGAGTARTVVGSWGRYQRTIGIADLASLIGLPSWTQTIRLIPVRRIVHDFRKAINEIIDSCEAQSADEASIIQMLLAWRDPETGQPLERDAIRNEIAVLFLAGHETTANALAWTWYLLSQTPDVEARVHDELAQVLGGKPPTLESVRQLVYLRAVLDEAMRLYPPVPVLGREVVRDEVIRNRPIPARSIVMVIPWLLHRHRHLWDKPDHFIPERFLPNSGTQRQRYAYIPYGAGPRVCAGAAFGHTEAMLCIATLAQRARLRLVPGTIVQPTSHITLRPGEILPMTIECRER